MLNVDVYDIVTVLSAIGIVVSIIGFIAPIKDLRYLNSIGNHSVRRIIAIANIRRSALYLSVFVLMFLSRVYVTLYDDHVVYRYTLVAMITIALVCAVLNIYDRYRMEKDGS